MSVRSVKRTRATRWLLSVAFAGAAGIAATPWTALLAQGQAAATGCATYRPIDRDVARSATDVRVDLTERGTLELGPQIGSGIVSLDGHIESVTDTTVRMSLKQVVSRAGDTQQWVGEAVTVPLSYVNVYRGRRPSVWRSVILGTALAAAVTAVAIAFKAGNSGSGRGDGTPIPR